LLVILFCAFSGLLFTLFAMLVDMEYNQNIRPGKLN